MSEVGMSVAALNHLAWLKGLAVGDVVYWRDPDDGVCSSVGVFRGANTESGKIETMEDMVYLGRDLSGNDANTEAYAEELVPLMPEPLFLIEVLQDCIHYMQSTYEVSQGDEVPSAEIEAERLIQRLDALIKQKK